MAKFTLSGTCGFVHHLTRLDEKYNNYNMTLYLDKKSKQTYVKEGCQAAVKTDDDGDFIVLRRSPMVVWNGEQQELQPPTVIDAKTGQKPTELIGRGSTVECEVETYVYKKHGGGLGTRLIGVKVLELIPYIPENAEAI